MRNFTAILLFVLIPVFLSTAQEQTRIVKGTLTDPQSGAPMPGVNVVIKGTTVGTVTDINGNYELEAPIGSTLVFSFVGYTTKEMRVEPLPAEKPSSDPGNPPKKIFRHTVPDDPEKTLSPYFFVKSDNPGIDQMPLKATSASVNIAGVIADVRIEQVYINTGENALEAVYIFPGSTRAAVYAMSMTIGKRKLIAKIKEKEKARQDFEQAKSEGKTATLLEQKRPNVFQMNVGNILPGDTITVELKYTELLVPVEGTYEFVYPTVVGPRYSEIPDDAAHAEEKWVENPYHEEGGKPDYTFHLKTRINSGIPIQKITSTSHNVNVIFEKRNTAEILLDESETFGGNRDFILRYRLRGGNVESGLLLHPREDENFFLLMVEPPETPRPEQIPPREYIFIVDVSGSMSGFPISVSKKLLRNLISDLRPTDRFNVMLFESSNQMLHPRSVAATQENIRDAISVLDEQRGGGGTRLYPALQNALSFGKPDEYSRTFIVVTDGYVTIEKEAFNLVRNNLNKANLFAFGIGSSVNRYLIEGLAHAGMGEPFIVTNEAEAEIMSKKFKKYIERPVLTNIKVKYDNFNVYDAEPLSVPDVFAERPVIIYGKYKGKAEGSITLTGLSGNETYVQHIDLASASQENNEALRYLWARNKIRYLDDYAGYYEDDVQGSNATKRAEQVTQLGLKYNLLTQYTSFIAVDSLIRTDGKQTEKVKQPLPLPQGVSNMAIGLRGFSLIPDIQSLTEVVVVGYGVQQRSSLTCSVASVEISNTTSINSPTINSALAGKVAGIMVTQNSGITENNTTVRIRGNSSALTSNSPLYIVDGVLLDNTDSPAGFANAYTPDRIADINPQDVASIEILKSTSAAAIYGSRGANGVVLITTKKPSAGRREINFTTSFSLDKVNKLPELQNQYAQGRPAGGTLQWQGADSDEIFSWGPSLNGLEYDGSPYAYDKSGRLTPAGSGNGIPANAYDRYDLFKTGFTFDNHLQISKSARNAQYDVSAGHTLQSGTIPGSGFNRTTLSLSGEKRFLGKFKLGSAILFSNSTADLVQKGNSPSSIMYGLMTTPTSFDNGNGRKGKNAASESSSYELPDRSPRSFSRGRIDNPYWSVNKNPYEADMNRIIPSVSVNYDILEWLSLDYKISGDVYRDKQHSGFDLYSAAFPSGRFTDRKESYGSINSELLFRGEKYLMDGSLKLNGIAGLNYFSSQRKIIRQDGEGMVQEGSFDPDNVTNLIQYKHSYAMNNYRFISKVNIEYGEFLSADLTASRENTSTLARGSGHLHSEGAGIALTFTQLPFVYISGDVLSSGKVFSSIGSIEKEAPLFLDPNFYYTATTDLNTFILNAERWNVNKNANLKAEKARSLEIGTTLGFWQNRIDLTALYYIGSTTDLFTPVISGDEVSLINGGVLNNKGFEVALRASILNRRLTWNAVVNFSRYRSILKSLPEGTDRIALAGFTSISSNLIAGQPYGVLYGTRYLRNDKGEMVIGSDGFPLVDPTLGVIGDPNPEWNMGIENSLSYKSITLEFLIDIRKGGDIWNGTKNTLNYFGTSRKTGDQREIKNYVFPGVTEEGQPNTTPVDFTSPSQDVFENRWVRYGRSGVAEDAIEDGSWIRMREVRLSYRFPQHLAVKLGLGSLSASFTARNLFLITKYSGIDPETNLTGNSNGRGLDYFNLPNYKSYGLSIRLGL